VNKPELPRCAGFLRRTIAVVVDMAIFIVLGSLVAIPVLKRIGTLHPASPADFLISVMASPPLARAAAWTVAALAILWWAYFLIGWGLLGATPGKRILGLAIIDHTGRHPIGPVRAQLRLVAYTLSSLPLCAGHFLVAFRTDHRALHDILAGTRVVRRRDLERNPAHPKSPTPGLPHQTN